MKFLVVDDDLVSRTKMQQILKEFGDCVLAESGHDAIAECVHAWDKGIPFDLISLDIGMPDMTGIDVLKAIRALEIHKGLKKEWVAKVVMVTSMADQDSVIGCMKAGCDSYIVKPFDLEKVKEKLGSLGFSLA